MKHLVTGLLFVFSMLFMVSCDEETISFTDLPTQAKQFLNEYYQDVRVANVEKDRDKDYSVTLESGVEIEFNKNGTWTSIESNFTAIPEGILLPNIVTDLKTRYPKQAVEVYDIEREQGGFELKINQDTRSLYYNNSGEFIRYGLDN